MKISCKVLLVLLSVLTFPLFSFAATPENKDVLLAAAPVWNIGDAWNFEANKKLDRVITQNLGMLAITMSLSKMEASSSHTVMGMETVNGEECYALKIAGRQNITGTYETSQEQSESMGGDIIQKSTFEGIEYRRVTDLAFVKSVLKASGTIEIGGILQGFPVPFQSDSITTSSTVCLSLDKERLVACFFPCHHHDNRDFLRYDGEFIQLCLQGHRPKPDTNQQWKEI
jgi:hypothetical protein